ncbi:hypothetical protein BV25DRAFT_1915595 [Artomyces pyxidatus]|uniref:Uncharacterized protein n=1 Tax=Artomyces pyxidatus TaxID=48021 RepID=A0ACB8T1X6_9AGAM|nr:hypothetical protein BV25DRAFT_1915595 [Artomyces pyxidatus]
MSNVDLSSSALHPFAASTEPIVSFLRNLLDATDQLAHTSNIHLATDTVFSNSKTVSQLRQQTAGQHSLHLTSNHIAQILSTARPNTNAYGEDIPLDDATLGDWCVSRLCIWGASVGMEAFPEAESEGRRTLVLGGSILVLDVVLSVRPRVSVASVHASYAVPNSTSEARGSVSLDAYLSWILTAFLDEVQKGAGTDPGEAAKKGAQIRESLKYLMQLDKLAVKEGDAGIRWFSGVDTLGAACEGFAKAEAEAIASSLSQPWAPLDIMLLRGHALPLPYLLSPTVSFLVHVSPLTYLSLQRSAPPSTPSATLPAINIPFTHLRPVLPLPGVTIATLTLTPLVTTLRPPPSPDLPSLSNRPNFTSAPATASCGQILPLPTGLEASRYVWTLEFAAPGVVMSQSRMREIEGIVNPLSEIGNVGNGTGMTFGASNWVDILLNRTHPISPERYTAVYNSPTGLHPPLQLHLTAPEEPGSILERVHVYTMTEVYAILEIVREQCWLNEIITGCEWTTEGLAHAPDNDSSDVSEDELQAVLNGTYTPIKIPVNVYLPPAAAALVLSSPEHPPIPGLVDIAIAYDASRPRGIAVDVRGAMGADIHVDILEEAVRRGGAFGLPGRVWAVAQKAG